MKVIFLQQLLYEWQAPMIFSAIAKNKGWKTSMYITPNPMYAAKHAINASADLVVFAAVTSGNTVYVYECAKEIKKICNIPIIVGGPHVTLHYDEMTMKNIDFLAIGEGELTFSALLDYLEKKANIESVPGVAYINGLQRVVNAPRYLTNIDEVPLMDRDLYYKYFLLKNEKVRMFYSGRGCIYNCSYCCVPTLNKMDPECPAIRKRSPMNLINEIIEVEAKYGLKASFFQDDSFIQDKNWLAEFLPMYKKKINKPFMCMARAIDIDEHTADFLANNGCVGIGIGVETANEAIRITKLNRFESNQQIINAIKSLKRNNIKVTTFNMIGIPEESLTNFKETIDFNKRLKVDSAWGVLFQPYVNSDFFCKDRSKKIAGNFYTELGYECKEKSKIELYQKLFPFFTRDFQHSNIRIEKIPRNIAYLIFCWFSFYREIKIWKRSFFVTLMTGIWNQVQYIKLNIKEQTSNGSHYKKN